MRFFDLLNPFTRFPSQHRRLLGVLLVGILAVAPSRVWAETITAEMVVSAVSDRTKATLSKTQFVLPEPLKAAFSKPLEVSNEDLRAIAEGLSTIYPDYVDRTVDSDDVVPQAGSDIRLSLLRVLIESRAHLKVGMRELSVTAVVKFLSLEVDEQACQSVLETLKTEKYSSLKNGVMDGLRPLADTEMHTFGHGTDHEIPRARESLATLDPSCPWLLQNSEQPPPKPR